MQFIKELAARQIYPKSSLYHDFRRISKSFAALPCNHPVAAKHMLFGLHCTTPRQLLPVYRDPVIWTTLSFPDKPCPLTGTLSS